MNLISDFVSPSPSNPVPQSAAALVPLACVGSALAHAALLQRCQAGPPRDRVAALRLLPRLIPFQPVRPFLLQARSRPQPAPVRAALDEALQRLPQPHEREACYRTAQAALRARYLADEEQRLGRAHRRGSPLVREHLHGCAVVLHGLFDYRFSWSDGCVGSLAPRQVQEFLLDYAPRSLLLAPLLRAEAPRLLARYLSWLGEAGCLLPGEARRLAILSLALSRRYQERAAATSPGAQDPLAAAALAGVPLQDAAALRRFAVLQRLDLLDDFLPPFSF